MSLALDFVRQYRPQPFFHGGDVHAFSPGIVLYLVAVYALCLRGLWRLGLRRESVLLAASALFFVLIALPLQTNYRFRVPALVPIYILAACGLARKPISLHAERKVDAGSSGNGPVQGKV